VTLKLRLPVAQRDLVRLGDVIGLDCSQSFTKALASLSQQLERVSGGILDSATIRISPMLLDEVSLKGRSDFVSRLQRVVDGPVPCGVVNHVASIPRSPRYERLGSVALPSICNCMAPPPGSIGRRFAAVSATCWGIGWLPPDTRAHDDA